MGIENWRVRSIVRGKMVVRAPSQSHWTGGGEQAVTHRLGSHLDCLTALTPFLQSRTRNIADECGRAVSFTCSVLSQVELRSSKSSVPRARTDTQKTRSRRHPPSRKDTSPRPFAMHLPLHSRPKSAATTRRSPPHVAGLSRLTLFVYALPQAHTRRSLGPPRPDAIRVSGWPTPEQALPNAAKRCDADFSEIRGDWSASSSKKRSLTQ